MAGKNETIVFIFLCLFIIFVSDCTGNVFGRVLH